MTKEELADRLNGREYCNEITAAEEILAKEAGLIVIFGASDDLCELRGAIRDEVGCYGGGEVLIDVDGKLIPEMEDNDIEVLQRHGLLEAAKKRVVGKIKALWCDGSGYSWTYGANIPHAHFDVMEDGDQFCRGIVINVKDLKSS